MAKGIIDNKKTGLVGKVLKDNIVRGSKVSVAAAHFTLYAFQALKKELSKIDEFRFLLAEPSFVKTNSINHETIHNNEKQLYGVEEEHASKLGLTQGQIAKALVRWMEQSGNKVQFRSMTSQKIQGGLYHLSNNNDEEVGIVGGAPFSLAGLGFNNSSNVYINTVIDDQGANKQLLSNFESIWQNKQQLQDVKAAIIQKLQVLYKENSPEFIYFVTLHNLFKEFLDGTRDLNDLKAKTGFEDTVIWNKLYNFQRDGVIGAINKIEKFNGCIIADSVGLGKTFEALAVIKYYELRNHRVLVLAPKKLHENWSIYRSNDNRNILSEDRFSYDLLNHTDLSRESGKSGNIDLEHVNWGNYDLVVIDESHNFRNNAARKDRVTRYSRMMNDIIKAGVKTKVLMLSATPVNNKLDDLKNQIAFITEGDDTALSTNANLSNISQTTRAAQSQFNRWSKLPDTERTTEKLLDLLSWDYFTLLDSLTIARSRKHIEKYYNVQDIGQFPQRLDPKNIKESIDLDGEFPALEQINDDILRLRLAVYSPMHYILHI